MQVESTRLFGHESYSIRKSGSLILYVDLAMPCSRESWGK